MLSFSRKQLVSIWDQGKNPRELANHLRVVALDLIQTAGSGHVGSSFSVMDIVLAIHMLEQGASFPSEPGDNYRVFSSKGHDAPALYAVNFLLNLIPKESMLLRRMGYLPGHPEIGSGGTVTNTGSLGMGISKAKGLASADARNGKFVTNYVILGDGELQEGQIWESLADANRLQGKVIAVVDANGIQSDTWVEKTRSLGDVRSRVEATGWLYLETNGHSFSEMREIFELAKSSSKPVFIWARTTKGYGSPLTSEFPSDGLFYHHHSGALPPDVAEAVRRDLINGVDPSRPAIQVNFMESPKMNLPVMVNHWAELLERKMLTNPKLIALDGDLALDTGTYRVAKSMPDRYLQMGIAEQDMVSTAGGLALGGYIPVVHGFSTFLTMRPYEQIVNNASEGTTVIYVGFLAGIVPSAAGFSHQAVNDLAIMCAVPNMKVYEPATLDELEEAFQLSIEHRGPSYLRLNSVSLPAPKGSRMQVGQLGATSFGSGSSYKIVCSGAFSLTKALEAQSLLEEQGYLGSILSVSAKSADQMDERLLDELENDGPLLLMENAIWHHGLMSQIELKCLIEGKLVLKLSVQGFPQNGQPHEVSHHHGFDAEGIAKLILAKLEK